MERVDPDETLRPVDVGLTEAERDFVTRGLCEWGGPARAAQESAILAGFADAEEMYAGTQRLRRALERQEPLSRRDWRRAAILTELIFASDFYGAGVEWEIVTGRDEVADLRLLRELQRKLIGVCPPPHDAAPPRAVAHTSKLAPRRQLARPSGR